MSSDGADSYLDGIVIETIFGVSESDTLYSTRNVWPNKFSYSTESQLIRMFPLFSTMSASFESPS